ncbi:hypothetical protein [Streptomyces misionensis]|uniref:hypothetical protein n=1 Tax=Streptomyces misionensis TaxID=67331 RepID=UPI0037D9EF08
MTRTWAAESGPRGVRGNAVAPGVTPTPGTESARPSSNAWPRRLRPEPRSLPRTSPTPSPSSPPTRPA